MKTQDQIKRKYQGSLQKYNGSILIYLTDLKKDKMCSSFSSYKKNIGLLLLNSKLNNKNISLKQKRRKSLLNSQSI